MAVIQSGASATQWTIDTTSDAGRVTFYDTNGNPMSNVSSLGNILNALNAAVTITLGGQSTAGITVTGTTGSLTLSFEATIDSTNWFSVNATPIPVANPVPSTTTNGQWVVDLGGFYAVRARISSFTSGSMTVSVVVSPQNSKNISQTIVVAGTVPVSGTINADGYATTSAPTYTNQTFNPLSLTTAGALRTDGSATTQPVSIAGTVPVSGTVTSNQGTPNSIGNSWPVEVTDGTNVLGTPTHPVRTDPTGTTTQPVSGTVTSNIGSTGGLALDATLTGGTQTTRVTDGTNTAAVKASSIAPLTTDPALVVTLSPNNSLFDFGGDKRLKVGQETLLFFDNVDGTTVDLNRWAQSQSGMTQTQTGGNLTLNAGSSLTSGNFSILTSSKQMLVIVEDPLYVQFRAKLIPQTNAVIELGFGNASGTATPSDGVFFRVDTSGNVKGVINFNTSETVTSTLFSISNTTFYNWEITIFEDHASFEVQSADGVTDVDVDLPIPATTGSPVSVGHLPIFARVYNNSATSTAAQMVIASVNAQQMDLATYKPWAEQMAGANRSATIDPSTFAQSANYTNSTVPATGTLSNTTASYTTLGGLYKFAAVAGAETDYALFAYQVPTGFTLYVTGLIITSAITGANSSTAATLLQWAVATNSSAVSLATGAPNPPFFTPIGLQTASKAATIGDIFDPGIITYAPKTPFVINSGKFFHIVLRVPVGNATASQLVRGSVTIEGYFE